MAGKTRGSVDNAATNRGGYDLFAARYSPSGSRLWTIQFGTAADDNVTGIAVDDAGNVYVCGFTSGGMDGVPSFGGIDAFVVKFNDNGVKLWSRQLGTSNDDFAFGIAADAAGNLFVAGATYGLIDNSATAGGGADMMLARLDASGNLLWVRQRGTPAWTRQFGTSAEDVGTGVAVDAIGDAFVSAYSAGGFDGIAGRGLNDGYLVKYRADGERQ